MIESESNFLAMRADWSRRKNEVGNMGVPLGDGGNKKFNWASELSTSFHKKLNVVLALSFFYVFIRSDLDSL